MTKKVEDIIRSGGIIESYPDDYPLPSALLYGYSKS
ncbi:DUF4258 domain-containing protein [Methanospirillum sp.]